MESDIMGSSEDQDKADIRKSLIRIISKCLSSSRHN